MNEEKNKFEEAEKLVSDTVKEMKEKVEKIAKEADKVDGEYAQKAAEIKEKAEEILKLTADKLEEAWKTVQDPEELKKTVKFVSEKSKVIYDQTIEKIDAYVKSDDFKTNVNNAEKFVKEAAEKTGDFAKEQYDKAMQNENFKKVNDGVIDVYNDVKKGVNGFLAKPEVQEGIDKAKDVTIDIAEKAVSALKDWLKPEEKKDEEK